MKLNPYLIPLFLGIGNIVLAIILPTSRFHQVCGWFGYSIACIILYKHYGGRHD